MASHTPNFDAKIKALLDTTEPGERVCALTGEKWNMDKKEIGIYRKYNAPPSQQSRLTRLRFLSSFFAGVVWWWHKDAETGEPLITYIHPHTKYKILKDDLWYQKDFASMGRDFDFNRPFFEQMLELSHEVPRSAWQNFEEPIDSIARASLGDQHSFFVAASRSKNSIYVSDAFDIEDSAEVIIAYNIQRSYNILHSRRISDSAFVRESYDCMNSWFLFDCRDCEYCFGAWNKRHKKYLWWNEQLSKEEWERRFAEVQTNSFSQLKDLRRRFQKVMKSKAVWPATFSENTQNSTGEYLNNTVNCDYCYFSDGAKNEYYATFGQMGSEENAFGSNPASNYCYMSPITVNSSKCSYCWNATRSQNLEYCMDCYDCEDCFGCVGLRRKKFHIMNKEYPEEEYWPMLDKIKTHLLEEGSYGNFFPGSFAFGPYRNSGAHVAYERFTQEQQEELKIFDFDSELSGAYGDIVKANPTSVKEIPDLVAPDALMDWKGKVMMCPQIHRPYSFYPLELEMYKKMKLPLPRKHFIQRILDMSYEMNLNTYLEGKCGSCEKTVTYSKNRTYPERKVYCKECYLRYIESHG